MGASIMMAHMAAPFRPRMAHRLFPIDEDLRTVPLEPKRMAAEKECAAQFMRIAV
jgi:hypothetical protein